MFGRARLKLTVWYLVIIMLVSGSFSIVIYRVLTHEFERFARAQRFRIERHLREGGSLPPEFRARFPALTIEEPELIAETKRRVGTVLVIINVGILVVSGGTGYVLAGRTLQPIKEMVEEQNRFVSDASHELRTPLTALKSSLEVGLRDKLLTVKDARIILSESIKDVNNLQSLSDKLLQLSEVQMPNTLIGMESVSLGLVIKNALQKIKSLAKTKGIKIEQDYQDIPLQANTQKLTELLILLVDNAIKYSPVKSTISVKTEANDGNITISVKDQGIGIDEKDLPHIFDRFFRADSARTKTAAGGYGLGLPIAKRIVELHHGSVTVVSKPGMGTTFRVILPRKQ